MITKERIDELIQQRAKVWGVGKQGNVFCVGLKFRPEMLKDKKWLENKYEVYGKLFETKAEAEWVSKMHTERLEYFRPPFELKDNEKYKFTTAKGGKMSISKFVRQSGDVEWWLSYVGTHRTFYSYTEVAEYARKLFIGEE